MRESRVSCQNIKSSWYVIDGNSRLKIGTSQPLGSRNSEGYPSTLCFSIADLSGCYFASTARESEKKEKGNETAKRERMGKEREKYDEKGRDNLFALKLCTRRSLE